MRSLGSCMPPRWPNGKRSPASAWRPSMSRSLSYSTPAGCWAARCGAGSTTRRPTATSWAPRSIVGWPRPGSRNRPPGTPRFRLGGAAQLPRATGQNTAQSNAASCSPCARGLDVLVEPEEVVRVVGCFDTGQAVVIDAVGVPNPVAALLTEVVHVHAVEVRVHGVEEFAGPSDVGWRVGGVVPLGQDQEVVVAAAMREGGRSRGDAAGRARDLLQADPGVR